IAARQAVASNAASVEAAREQFGIGRRSMVDLLDAQRDFVRAQETLIRAELDRFLTDYAALALTGDILDLFDITLPEPPQ
ncbi:MAG: TolC family protein, partial [Roseovarius sp.]|nr:TolC family protein [Roseovarius sp.]